MRMTTMSPLLRRPSAGVFAASLAVLTSFTALTLISACGSDAPQAATEPTEADAAASARAQGEYLPDGAAAERVPAPVRQAVQQVAEIDAVTGYRDPVCGMKVAPDAPVRHTHEGVTYGFCSESCEGRFAAAPADYLAALEE